MTAQPDLALVADILEVAGCSGMMPYKADSILEQARLCREADNATGEAVTVDRSGGLPELPTPAHPTHSLGPLYSAAQMRWYGKQVRRLAAPEQPGSAVQGAVAFRCKATNAFTIEPLWSSWADLEGHQRDHDYALKQGWPVEYAYTTPLPAPAAEQGEMSPEFTDSARAALAWVLYHHQGGSSAVGQAIRFALGMGEHEPLPAWRITEAKAWAERTGSKSADFHAAQPEARGVEGMMIPAVSPNGSDEDMLKYLDELLAAQGTLMFARGNYNEDQAECFGVAILDFMRLYGMRLRAKLTAALAHKAQEESNG